MTLPATGAIDTSQVRLEATGLTTGQLDFGNSCVRAIAGKPTGSIGLFDLRGKSITPAVLSSTGYFYDVLGFSGPISSFINISFGTDLSVSVFATKTGGFNESLFGTPTSATWGLCSLTPGDFQIQASFSTSFGTLTVTNPASTFQTLGSARLFRTQLSAPGAGVTTAEGVWTFTIRRTAQTSVTNTYTVTVGHYIEY